ncbi:hypothetical protein [Actinoplanes aureus]|uniref:DNA-binding protein n=1 Tax=Actinoplanes aureus TaxID=2792083 RepID=A0A931C8Y5_9ACTN|nr:hypothetical protein [Actinoplanes aureus]MBG0562256.1 hypothetical protein [Actinoplanes aureus]
MSETLLEAGAILPGPAQGAGIDAMTARAYRHEALAGRTVVRLVGATLGPAEDLTMDFLGFQPLSEPVAVGSARRQALGFPAWALVHDPANGRHALALVKEMEKLARAARSKPGNAKDGYEVLAGRLGAAAPAFLPTFWEQAGRAFLAADNQRMAGTCFTEARRAEQVHGLTVDEDRVRDVHLEFAFAGALTAAMLAEYARGVVDRRPAAEAYELVKTLALRRVAGGLAPHASMAADLARLAKAAGLDPEQQADEVVTRLLAYPAMSRATPSVWKSYRRSLVRLGKREATVRARLLAIVPEPPGYGTDMTTQWIELLEASGAAADLIAGAPAAGSASRWLERVLAGRRGKRRNALLLSLVERLLPRLAGEDGLQVSPAPWGTELDVLDLCLAGGVPARVGSQHVANGFDLASWATDEGEGRRDLAAVAADRTLRPMLASSVRTALLRLRTGEALTSPALPEQTLEQAFGAAGVREVLVEMIREQSARSGDGTVTSLDADLTGLAPLWSAAGMALAPDGFRRLPDIDVPAVLARTLRGGLLTELSWPAYEAAARATKTIRIGEAWPELVVFDLQTAHVIAPGGTVTEHLFRYPPQGHPHAPRHYSQPSCLYTDGELLVAWNGESGPAAYWSSRPDDLVDGEWRSGRAGWGVPMEPLPVPGGGLTTGARPVHPGDARGPADMYPVAGDGQAFWRCEHVQGASGEWEWRWREFDPRTGEAGRVSMPAFFTAPGDRLVAEACVLRPAPREFAGSPLGWRDGLVGWRTTRTPDGAQAGEGVDGRRVTLPRARFQRLHADREDDRLVGAVTLPGSPAPLPVTVAGGYSRDRLRVWTADGEYVLAELAETTSTLPPLAWWHGLRTRDEAGSAALRAIDEATAARLLAVDDSVTGTGRVKEAVTANIEAHLPQVTDATLRSRIAEVVARAVRLRRRIAEVPRHLASRPGPARTVPAVSDEALREAWQGLCDTGRTSSRYYYGSAGARYDVLEQISTVGAVLGRPDAGDHPAVPALSANWTSLLAGLGAVALRAASPATGDAGREALTAFLAALSGTPLAGDGPPLRILRVAQQMETLEEVNVRRDEAGVTVLFPSIHGYYQRGTPSERNAVQVAREGGFKPPAGTTVSAEAYPSGRLSRERLSAFGALLRERGPAPWRPDAAEALAAATGMTRAEAVLLLAGLPGIDTWEANFLSPEQRTLLGLSAAHAKVAKSALQGLSEHERVVLLDAAMPVDPAELWERGPDVAAIAEAWIRLRGRRVAVPEELVAALDRVVDSARAADLLQVIAAPQAGDWLSTDGRSTAEGYYHVETVSDTGTPFDQRYLFAVAAALPWLGYHLRWDDPLRATLPEALRLVRARLRNPGLLVGYAVRPLDSRPEAGPALVDGQGYQDFMIFHIAPAKLTGADDPALGFIDESTREALRTLLSGWIDEVVSTPDGGSGDPHDPRVSAPHLVGEVGERFGLDTGAAAYYLQLLALPDPTDKAVQAFNGWTAAQLRKAREALVTADLVVTAKRERAGRPVFLPGGWLPARAPMLPVEAWKQELYAHTGRMRVVTRSLPRLFAAAWARITEGDVPRYRDLEEKP